MPAEGPGLTVTIALGGNAILSREGAGTIEEQLSSVRATAVEVVRMVKDGKKVILTHGNGPQVGDILLMNEMARGKVPVMPLDVCGAESQGMIGYMLQQALQVELRRNGLSTPVVTILTQVLVDRDDPAFTNPTKPVGPYYSQVEAKGLIKKRGWDMVEDSGHGYRRVVPSPIPREILERDTISSLFEEGVLVIAAGGGGIPVAELKDGSIGGVEAVLDKDRTAALLASAMRTKVLLILTDVDGVYLGYGGPKKRLVRRLKVKEAEKYLMEGQFPSGSMGPKVESAVTFLRSGGERAVISSLASAEEALMGRSGTTIVP